MTKYKFKDENNNWIPLVQNVYVNGASIFDGIKADFSVKTINGQSILGIGNIEIQGGGGEYVKYTANQNLTTQQQLNARNNISALGFADIKQGTGNSTTNVISQKGVTDLLATKQNVKPNGVDTLIASDTGKINLAYMPSAILGGLTFGGTFNEDGTISASEYARELDGQNITQVAFGSYPSYYFIYSSSQETDFFGYTFSAGDWAVCLGTGWQKIDATDAVTSVNGKMGQVVLDANDVGAVPSSMGYDNRNKNLVTDADGNVTTSDYALGQIIVNYYSELPVGVPETAKASVIDGEAIYKPFTTDMFQDSEDNGTALPNMYFPETPVNYYGGYLNMGNEEGTMAWFCGIDAGYGADDYVFHVDENNEGNDTYYIYSWIQQEYANEPTITLQIGWNKIYYDQDTGDALIEYITYSDVPSANAPIIYDFNCTEAFANDLHYLEYKLAGEYIYVKEEPVTDPPTYYWKYNPSNVQSDMAENDPSALSYIRNRAELRTNLTSTLPTGTETITGQIRLHKISKTGQYSDLKNQVGMKDENNPLGEIFGVYSGIDINKATGSYAAAFGSKNEATAHSSFVEGSQNHATGTSSHAEGNVTEATNMAAHSEGQFTHATGNSSHAEGTSSRASGTASHAEGDNTKAVGQNSHAEGGASEANNICSHAEGYYCKANGDFGHAEGYATEVKSSYGHAQNYGTIARYAQTSIGKFNVDDTQSTQAFIIGNGADNNNRSNIHTVDWNGNAWFKGGIRVGGTNYNNASPLTTAIMRIW